MTTTTLIATAEAPGGTTAAAPVRIGPVNDRSAEEILALLQDHALRLGFSGDRQRRLRRGARFILQWLQAHPGDGWQQRWIAAEADAGLDWLDVIPKHVSCGPTQRRATNAAGLASLLLNRVVLPSYDLVAVYCPLSLYRETRRSIRPDAFARITARATEAGMVERRKAEGLNVLSRLVLHTGRDVDQLTSDDFDELRASRLGGDEFVIVFAYGRDSSSAGLMTSAACAVGGAVGLPLEVGPVRIEPGASMGTAYAPALRARLREMLAEADAAMYRAKRGGSEAHSRIVPLDGRHVPQRCLTMRARDRHVWVESP